MIFKTVLKYKIFEYCLDSIFNGISKLVITGPTEPLKIYNLRQGMYLSEIKIHGWTFFGCQIMSILRLPDTDISNRESYTLSFHYKQTITNATELPNPFWVLVMADDNQWIFTQ